MTEPQTEPHGDPLPEPPVEPDETPEPAHRVEDHDSEPPEGPAAHLADPQDITEP